MRITLIGGSRDKTTVDYSTPPETLCVPVLAELSPALMWDESPVGIHDTFKQEYYHLAFFCGCPYYIWEKQRYFNIAERLLDFYGSGGKQ